MPELWIPFGNVETLVTLQAENLGLVAEPPSAGGSVELERIAELLKGSTKVFVCDNAPGTLELLRVVSQSVIESSDLRLYASAPKRIEGQVTDLRGRVSTLPPPIPGEDESPAFAPELTEPGPKLFVGTARPDPLFGIVDPRVEACLNWVAGSHALAAKASKSMEPEAFQKTDAYDASLALGERIKDAKFLTVVPSGGKMRSVLEDAPFDAVKNDFPKTQMTPAKGLVVGVGGRGYDDTFSSSLRVFWSVIQGVRKAGSVLLLAECGEGAGSTALEMLFTGRILGQGDRRRERYVDGLEEVFYLNKLKDEYDVLLLSGLPESYSRTKLGLTTAKGSGEAVGRMLNKVGRTGKLNVIPRAAETHIQSG